jgi:plasmid stabilization system protein ParE
MARIIWSPDAASDLQRHLKWISEEASLTIALKWASKFRDAVSALERFPELGAPVEELPFTHLRERLLGRYRILYFFDGADCRIVRIVRAEQDLLRVFTVDDFPT